MASSIPPNSVRCWNSSTATYRVQSVSSISKLPTRRETVTSSSRNSSRGGRTSDEAPAKQQSSPHVSNVRGRNLMQAPWLADPSIQRETRRMRHDELVWIYAAQTPLLRDEY